MTELAQQVLEVNRTAGRTIATAESCTGGMVAAALTDIAGSSDVFVAGLVTYSNEAKTELLGVPADLIERHGAVSVEVAEAMAIGARERTGADMSVSITGIAGPDGGSPDKPVGTVCFGLATADSVKSERKQFDEHASRAEIRRQAASWALSLLLP